MDLSGRMAALGESATLAVQRAAQELKARGVDVVDLGVGEPDLATPQPVIEATIAALRAGLTRYTPAIGIPELRDAIAERYASEFSGPWRRPWVAVTNGAKQALYNVFMCLFESGDEVLVPTPCWVSFPEQVRLTGAAVRFLPCSYEQGFLPTASQIEAAVGDNTRGIVLNSPCNPSGAVLSDQELARIVDVAVRRNLYLVFDETYEKLVYDGEHASAARYHGALGERLVLINTFSKTYAMTGMRVGYVLAQPALIDAIANLQGHTTSNPASITQHGALAALRQGDDFVRGMREEFARRRDWIAAELAGIEGVELAPPAGTFYAFPRVAGAMQRLGIGTTSELAERLMTEAHVGVVPGSAFEAEGFIRVSFAASIEQLKEGVQRLGRVLQGR